MSSPRRDGVSTFATGPVSNVTYTANDGFDFSGGGEVCGTGIVQTGSAVLPRDQRTVDKVFNTSVFKRPSGRGDLGNNCDNAKFTLPGFNSHDLALFAADGAQTNTSFGQVTSARDGRKMMLGLKFSF